MDSQKRTRLTVIFSQPEMPYDDVLNWLSPNLGKVFAGATCYPVDGIWSSDGALWKDSYEEGAREQGVKITITISVDQAERAMTEIKRIIGDMKISLRLNINWVHVEQTEITALHFEVG